MASSWGTSWGSAWGSSWGGTSGPVLPNRGPFQCGLFQPNVFQNDCTVPSDTGPQGGGWEPGGEFRQRVGGDDFFLRPLPKQIERAIESVVREATPTEAPVVLEAKVERAGFDWDGAYLQIAQEMQRRNVETIAALRNEIAGEIAAQRLIEQGRNAIALQMRRDNDAIALLLLLH